MRTTRLLLATVKEVPADAEVISHQLMLRAGMIRKLAAGLYTWLPLGLRVLRKVEAIVREEMDRAGAQEVLMPAIQPAELWQESGRWGEFGPELLRLHDRHQREFCVGPTHEEVITDMVRREIRSYKQLPSNFYQIQAKFRDETRPRFGVMRAREFLMKDAYSFDLDKEGLDRSYQTMRATYTRIFSRTGLDFRVVKADTGAIGGSGSEEFHVLADSGEDAIAFSSKGDYAANIEMAATVPSLEPRAAATDTLAEQATPGVQSIEEVSKFLDVPATRCLKTLLVEGVDDQLVALVLRGDHQLNLIKAGKHPLVTTPVTLATEKQVRAATGASPGSIGPIGLSIPVIADYAALEATDFVCGANVDGQHLSGTNWERDLPLAEAADLRNVVDGDPSPDGHGTLAIARGIEVGHIFQLGTKYSEAMNAVCLNEAGKAVALSMGCYGIGVSRVVAAAIEQNHDARGITWPTAIAPFQVALLPMNMHKSTRLKAAMEILYSELCEAGIEVLFDDRRVRPGVMFADAELIGIPHRIVLGDRGLDSGMAEYKGRRDEENTEIPVAEVAAWVGKRIVTELTAS